MGLRAVRGRLGRHGRRLRAVPRRDGVAGAGRHDVHGAAEREPDKLAQREAISVTNGLAKLKPILKPQSEPNCEPEFKPDSGTFNLAQRESERATERFAHTEPICQSNIQPEHEPNPFADLNSLAGTWKDNEVQRP